MAARRSRLLVLVGATVALATGCGGGSGPRTSPARAPRGLAADPAAVSVIRAWSTALRSGDVRAAARYFALPSQFVNGPDSGGGLSVIAIQTLGEAEAVNATLPCGAELISAEQRGPYINALFRLTDRPGLGEGCGSGAGQVARTNFLIVGGRIRKWIRAPQEPGDGGGAGPPGPAPPSGQQGTGPSI